MENVENILIMLGVTPNLNGFDYICDAVDLINNSQKKIPMMELYDSVAEKRNTTVTHVERAIRYAISKADLEVWFPFGGYRTTNSEFLFLLALKIKQGGIHK